MSIVPPLEKYRVREVDFNGHTRPIVLHARGGSSLLVALANAVLLSKDIRKAFKTEGGVRGRPKYVCTEVLFQIIEMSIVDRLQSLLKSKVIDIKAMVGAWKHCRRIIRLLTRDYDVDPIYTSCTAFAQSVLDPLFPMLGFQLYHGSVIDPEKDRDTANAIGSKSFSEILEILKSPPAEVEENTALVMKKFVENTEVRLTSYGLTCLKESIGDAIGILFRYDRFSMLCEIDGVLVTLQSTEEQFKKNPDAVWQSLEEVNDDGMLLSSNNVQVKKQAVITDAEEAIALKRQEAIIQDETREKLKLSKPSSKQRKRAAKRTAGKSQFDMQPEFVELEEVVTCDKKTEQELKGSKPSDGEPDRLKQQELEVEPEETEEERDDNMSERFICFLREFGEEGATKPFYEGQVKALDYCKSFKLTIKFKDLESCDRETARYICNNTPRVSERLRYCVSKFLLEHEEFKMKSEEVFLKTKIEICDLPAPNSVQYFSKFAKENDMHKLWELFDYGKRKIVSATTYLGRKAALGYLRFILKKHKARKCWNGSFQLEDLVVLVHGDGSLEFVITTKASEGFDNEKAIADFNRFCVLVFPYFMDDTADEMPAYFDEFQLDYLVHMPNCDNTEEYDRWQKYMANNFAFKSPQSCTMLITETFEICDSERTGSTYQLLDCAGDLVEWASLVQSSGSLSLNDTYDFGNNDPLESRYNELSYWKLLMYGRHYSRHMLRAKRDKGIKIKVQDLLIIHLMLAHGLKGEMAKVIRYMMKVNGFAGGLFSSAWRHFEASETFDDEENYMLPHEDVKEICLDSAEVANVSSGEDSKAPPVDKCDGATTSSEVVSQG